ncbi:MAG: 23S rRNA (adenine(2503)-C(2))-methyltransferase RlmN, partial [Candidatus Omnitrophica bacterium]|nr:23S rRNA (adenine(2503)-C(2))-methyltransferase RlmN [Candidatus Omnitrophota bacterium]
MTSVPDIRGLSLEELSLYLKSVAHAPFRAGQIFQWIYQKDARSFDEMTNLPVELREVLQTDFIFKSPAIARQFVSEDKTAKFLFDLHDHEKIESVFIPTKTRATACISTQAGCKFGCRFCASGIGGWKRNLDVAEIMAQVLHVKQEALKIKKPLSNIVFMGTGEPMDNYDNVLKAIRLINAKEGMNMGARHITVSTVGIVPGMRQLAQEGLQVELAVSLHGYDNPSRDVLMPVNKKYPFEVLMAACRDYCRQTNRQITFEYVLIKD